MNVCAVCGKEARDPVKALDIKIEYAEGDTRSIKIDRCDQGSFCQEHFMRFVALKVEDFRKVNENPVRVFNDSNELLE